VSQTTAPEVDVDTLIPSSYTWTQTLATAGIGSLGQPYPAAIVSRWNGELDPVFADGAGQGRSYVGADQLAVLGIVAEALTPGVRALIRSLVPDAIV
jgi:hypothetical protein